jgi:hypothetical protein
MTHSTPPTIAEAAAIIAEIAMHHPHHHGTCGATPAAHPPESVKDRFAREAPLVALVAAAPGWADPVAWRAAVLAVDEIANGCDRSRRCSISDVWGERDTSWLRDHHDGPCDLPEWCAKRVAHDAYRRALAPSAAVRPEWRERLPFGLTCNAYEVP